MHHWSWSRASVLLKRSLVDLTRRTTAPLHVSQPSCHPAQVLCSNLAASLFILKHPPFRTSAGILCPWGSTWLPPYKSLLPNLISEAPDHTVCQAPTLCPHLSPDSACFCVITFDP